MIYPSVLEAVGRTPIVRLSRVQPGLGRDLYMKLELTNPGGSHKVRIAIGMIDAAEREGILVPGSGQTIIEPTGGNTGVGLAMVAAVRGYRLVLVIPDNYSPAKQTLLRALGAEIILSDSRKGGNSHGELAGELMLANPEWVLLNQQRNPANPEAHRTATAQEVLDDFAEGHLDAFVGGVGTGGHLTGLGQVLRQRWPDLVVVAVQPEGCSLLQNCFVHHEIQGLAVGLVPQVLDLSLIDEEAPVAYEDAAAMMGQLMRTEGLAVGLSSAANVVAGIRVAEALPPGSRVLTMAYDSAGDYLEALDPTIGHEPSVGREEVNV